MQKTTTTRTRTLTLLTITFVVSFCSFAYEFVYSELLTVMYGGTVTQYVITIGLYFFSLGVGSALSDDLSADRSSNFFRTEVYLAAAAPAGFMLIVALNSVTLPTWIPHSFVWVLARLPVIVVGLLSGFELPLLTRLVGEVESDSVRLPSPLRSLFDRLYAGGRWCLGLLWHTESRGNTQAENEGSTQTETGEKTRSGLSVVLAIDYIGGLFGAVVYARVLYPQLGLVPTIFVLALLNALAALAFVVRFSARPWGIFANESRSPSALISHESRVLVAVCLLLTVGYAGAAVNYEQVDHRITELYREHQIESEYPADTMDIEITYQETTRYQHIIRYRRTWTGNGSNPYFTGTTETCLRLGTAVQLCESWADSYHNGLVDVPMSMYEHSPQTDVLVIGGGDWIAIDHLREYNVSIDHVDIDAQFMRHAKRTPFLRRWHDASYTYPRLNTTVGDGYAYLRQTTQRYDLILLDIPGATDDDLLKLYSMEFYRSLRKHLEDDGVVVTWAYSADAYPRHHKAYVNTVRAAGFTQYVPYWAWEDIDSDGQTERVERFYILAPGERAPLGFPHETAYVRQYAERYGDLQWWPVPRYDGVRVNSVFHPNYDIIIDS